MMVLMSGFETPPSIRYRHFVFWTVAMLSVLLCFAVNDFSLFALFDSEGIANASGIFNGLLHPDLSADFLIRLCWLSFESLLIGILATVMALAVGIILALIAIRVPDLPDPPGASNIVLNLCAEFTRWFARLVMAITRSVPEIVWAYMFVRLMGLGAGPAVFAIALTVGGTIGKLYSEVAEAVPIGPIRAMRAAGSGRWAILLFAVIPQVSRQWIAYGLFRLECNIRTGTILGVVGAGGLGSEIALSIQYFEYDKLASTLLAVLLFVVLLEFVSAYLRGKTARISLGLAAIGTVIAVAVLDIPWGAVFTGQFTWLGSMDGFRVSAAMIWEALAQVGETLSMAWGATMAAAAIAFCLAPIATTPLMATSYIAGGYRRRGFTGVISWAFLCLARGVLQVFRAMPELTFALIFVVWVGAGPFAGMLAIGTHSIGVLGRLYTDIYEEVEPGPAQALQAMGASAFAVWLFAILPQVKARLAAYTLFRFEVNVRATAMMGFVGAGGIGDALHTAISLFHTADLIFLLGVLVTIVIVIDAIGDRARREILRKDQLAPQRTGRSIITPGPEPITT